MNRLKPWLAMLVLALWASCTIRCELVCLTGANETACCVSTASDVPATPAPADECVCSWAKSGGYIAERSFVQMPLPVALPLFLLADHLDVPTRDAHASELHFPPPELPTTWRFSVRAALPPRAPSFVS